jgi:ApbE superfamily uncharacterized protein (UPF0280 family)
VENDIIEERIDQLESSFIIKTEKTPGLDQLREILSNTRQDLEEYIKKFPTFASSMQPVPIESSAPAIIQKMAFAASLTNVGPMASVAGALVDIIFERIWELGSRHLLIENGGEIMAYSDIKRHAFNVGIYAGPNSPLNQVAFVLPQNKTIGIGTSSATIGHATSLGEADLVSVFAKTSSIADSAATNICNSVVGEDIPRSIERGIHLAKEYSNIIDGVFIVRSEKVSTWGNIPNMVLVQDQPR